MPTRRFGCLIARNHEAEPYWTTMLHAVDACTAKGVILCSEAFAEHRPPNLSDNWHFMSISDTTCSNLELLKHILASDNIPEISSFDELILLDDSIYGPLYPLSDIWKRMDAEYPDADCWGITTIGANYGEALSMDHLQDYFLVIRKSMLRKETFWQHWDAFSYAAFCDMRELEKHTSQKMDHKIYSPMELLQKFRSPFLGREVFLESKPALLEYNHGDEGSSCLSYIANHYSYNLDNIYNDLIRHQNIMDFINAQNAVHIVNPDTHNHFSGYFPDAAMIVHLYYMDLLETYRPYLENLPSDIDLYITTDSEEKATLISTIYGSILSRHEHHEIRVLPSRGRELSALLLGCQDIFKGYKFLGFLHDKKSSRDAEAVAIGHTFSEMLWKNMLASPSYVRNILEQFFKQPHVGLMIPLPPYHGTYLPVSDNYWTGCFETAKEFLENHSISVPLDLGISPPSLGTVFWTRTTVFSKILSNLSYEDFPLEPMPIDGTINHMFERIAPYLAQDQGYYTSYISTDAYAAAEILNFKALYYDSYRKTRVQEVHIDGLDQIVCGLRKDVQTKEQDNQTLLADNQKLFSENKQFLADNQKLLADNQKLLADNQKLLADIDRLLLEKDELASKLQIAQDYVDALINSKSWKLTKPLRQIGDLLHRKK